MRERVGRGGTALLMLALAALAVSQLAGVAGCRGAAAGAPPGSTAATGERGMLVIGRFGGISGLAALTTITADGLVEWRSDGAQGLGRVSPQDVAAFITTARSAGFFDWKATYATARPVADALTTTLIITPATGKQHGVSYTSGADAPAALAGVFGQVSLMDVAGRQQAFTTETAAAIFAARALYAQVAATLDATQMAQGPCISQQIIPGWCVDIAHDPRVRADNDPANQCQSFLTGQVKHFVEIAPNGDFIRAQ